MKCSVCTKSIAADSRVKISCNDCKECFHFACVNITEDEVIYFKESGTAFRCDKCRTLRRRSLLNNETVKINKPRLVTTNASLPCINDNNDALKANESVVIDNEGESEYTLRMIYLKLTKLEETNNRFLKELNELTSENEKLKNRVDFLENKLNWQQQHLLSNCVDIVGIPDVDNQNAKIKAKEFFQKALSVEVPDEKIESCFVKKPRNRGGKDGVVGNSSTKSIICLKFSDHSMKKVIMKEKMKRKQNLNSNVFGVSSSSSGSKGMAIYVNDALTKYTQALFMQAKEAKKNKGYKYLWYKNNHILARKDDGGNVIAIKTFNDLALSFFSKICSVKLILKL